MIVLMIFFSFFCCFSLTALRKLQQGPKEIEYLWYLSFFCVYFGYVPDCYLCLNLCLLSSLWENGNCKFIFFFFFFWGSSSFLFQCLDELYKWFYVRPFFVCLSVGFRVVILYVCLCCLSFNMYKYMFAFYEIVSVLKILWFLLFNVNTFAINMFIKIDPCFDNMMTF